MLDSTLKIHILSPQFSQLCNHKTLPFIETLDLRKLQLICSHSVLILKLKACFCLLVLFLNACILDWHFHCFLSKVWKNEQNTQLL